MGLYYRFACSHYPLLFLELVRSLWAMELFKQLAKAAFWIILGMVVGVILAYIIKSMIKKD